MEMTNYLNFDFNLLSKYKTIFLLGKLTLINDIEKKIINFLNKKNSLQIFRYDLKININISDIKKNILIKNFFYYEKLFILKAEEIWFHNYSLKKNFLLINKLINNNYYLIVKNNFSQKSDINLLKEYKIKDALIINCNINNFNDFKKFLILKYKNVNLNFSNILYKFLYLIYHLDKLNFYNLIKYFFLNYSNSLLTFKNIDKCFLLNKFFFNLENFFKHLYKKNLFFIVINLITLKMFFKKDKISYIFEELKKIFLILLIKFFNFKNHNNFHYIKNQNIDIYLHKIRLKLTLKTIYKILNLLNDIEYIMANLFLDNEKKCQLIYKNLFNITLLIFLN